MIFTLSTGDTVWIPKGRILFAEAGPGGLTTVVTLIAPPGFKAPLQQFEVQGSVQTNFGTVA